MLFTELGMLISFRFEQFANAHSPMLSTESGMLIVFRLEQSSYLQLIVCQLVLV